MNPQNPPAGDKAPVPPWRWRAGVGLLTITLLTGLALVVALKLGWRSPTPPRPPDWIARHTDWHVTGNGTARVTGDGLRVSLSQPEQRVWALAGQSFTDLEAVLQVRALQPGEDTGFGLIYRYQDDDNFYLFAIGGDGTYTVARVGNGELTPLRPWQEWPHVRRGAAVNRLRLHCEGPTCRFFINDEFTTEVTDATFLSGDVGLWAETFSDPALDVVFEELQVWMVRHTRSGRSPDRARCGIPPTATAAPSGCRP